MRLRSRTLTLVAVAVGGVMLAAAAQQYIQSLKVGGGYGNSGVDITSAGNVLVDGNLTVDGTITGTVSGGGDALTTDGLDQFAATTSAEFAGVISNETGSGLVVLATSPALTTPNLGTPSAVTLTNGTGLPIAGLASQSEARILGRAVGAGTGAVTALTVDQVVQFLYRKTTLTSGATPAWTCTDGIKFKLTLAHNATIQAATGTPFDGQPAEFLIIQDGSSAYTCAFATGSSKAFIAGDDFSDTIPAVSSTLSSKSYYKFEYDSGADRFVLMATSVS